MIENEVSYLVREMPDLSSVPFKDIEQHYLSKGPQPLRLRRAEGAAELTKKLRLDPDDLSRRDEINVPLTDEEYAMLRPLATRGLEKRRYKVPLADGLIAELDVFKGSLEGLVKVEVEFPDDAARAAFRPPAWFGRDVSQEKWSSNSWLAGKTYADVKKKMDE
jgi:adenylate cyclase